MSPRPRLTLLAATLCAALSLALPALAQDGAGDRPDGAFAPSLESAAPLVAETPAKRAKGEPAPEERQAPPPAPSGCPFRDGKLELIA